MYYIVVVVVVDYFRAVAMIGRRRRTCPKVPSETRDIYSPVLGSCMLIPSQRLSMMITKMKWMGNIDNSICL